ncbi:hypothetical protein [Pseudomonas putida]
MQGIWRQRLWVGVVATPIVAAGVAYAWRLQELSATQLLD